MNILALLICWIYCIQRYYAIDPCLTENHILLKDQHYRSTGNALETGETSAYDGFLATGWYRFESLAGNDMPTSVPPSKACGAFFPIWLNGEIPPEGETIQYQACARVFGNPCATHYNVTVKNCVMFNTYLLGPTDAPGESYCIGSETRCPDGESSETGFTPGCSSDGFPVLNGSVEVGFVINDGDGQDETPRKVDMTCQLNNAPQDIFLDVKWSFSGGEIFLNEKIQSSDFPAIAPEDVWRKYGRMGDTIKCTLRPRYREDSPPGFAIEGEYFMGFVALTNDITFGEGEVGFYRFYSTIPILAPVGYEGGDLEINVIVPNVQNNICDQTEVVVDFTKTQCGIQLPFQKNVGPNIVYNISITGVVDGGYDGDHDIVMRVRTAKEHHLHPIWADYELESTRVHIIDGDFSIAGKVCKSRDDPHMTTFDGRIYENQLEGEFIMYRHTTLPIEVQAYYKKCGSYATCNCGAAVRAGGDLFIYDRCRDGFPLRTRLYECEDKALAYTHDGSTFEVTIITTGTVVRIGSWFVEIYPSVNDIGRTEGLCGTFDGDCSNEFYKRDGSFDSTAGTNSPQCDRHMGFDFNIHYNNFSNSWRVDTTESLYKGKLQPQAHMLPDTIYCSCAPNKTSRCEKSTFNPFCTKSILPIENECLDARKRRAAGMAIDDVEEDVVLFEYDTNFAPPPADWKNGWNETSARAFCESYLLDRASTDTCNNLGVIDTSTSIDSCIADIHLSGDTSFSAGHLEDLLHTCDEEVRKNISYYKNSNDGDTTSAPAIDVLQNVCPSDCNDRGTCARGVCMCHDGFTGHDCSLVEDQIPTLYSIQFEGLCDLKSRACRVSPVYGDTFIESENLTCSVTLFTVSLSDIWTRHDTTIFQATYSHPERVLCPLTLPQFANKDTVTFAYELAVSNDGTRFSDGRNMTVTHSDCLNCINGQSCSIQRGYCFILDNCYAEGDTEPGYDCSVCRSASQPLQWTLENPQACEENNNENRGNYVSGRIGISELIPLSMLTVLIFAI